MQMWAAFNDRINNTPFLYFFIGWFWTKIFGASELSLRLFSSLGFSTALCVVWVTLRRNYTLVVTCFGVLAVFCTSNFILAQNAEARMYGLFLTVCALGLLQYSNFYNSSGPVSSRKLLLINTCIHTAIVHTHLFGIFYSGAILASHILSDKLYRLLRLRLYVSILLGWLSLLFYIPSFLVQASAGNPRSWMPLPDRSDLLNLLNAPLPFLLGIGLFTWLVLLAGLGAFLEESDSKKLKHDRKAELPLLLFACNFLAVPVLVWLVSRTIKPIFIDRYMIPTQLSWSILFCAFFSRIDISFFTVPVSIEISKKPFQWFIGLLLNMTAAALVLLLLLYPIKYSINFPASPKPGIEDKKYGYAELPIVVQFSHDFLTRFFYASERDRYFFILDWEAASSQLSGLFAPQECKHLEALKRSYPNYFSDHIVQSKDFLKKQQRFLVLDFFEYRQTCGLERTSANFLCPQWLENRIFNNPVYRVKELGEVDEERKLLLVEKT